MFLKLNKSLLHKALLYYSILPLPRLMSVSQRRCQQQNVHATERSCKLRVANTAGGAVS